MVSFFIVLSCILYDICRISRGKLTALQKWYKENGLVSRRKQSGGDKLSIPFDDIKHVAGFITRYTEKNALLLPGRVSSHSRDDIQFLPQSHQKLTSLACMNKQ